MFDTNVLVSALLVPHSKPRHAFDLAVQKGKVLMSLSLLAELVEVLGRERFRRYVGEEDVRKFIAAVARETEWIEVKIQITVCRDSSDDKLLELAVSGHATHIITGDADLLVLNPFQGIEIIPPLTFLSL